MFKELMPLLRDRAVLMTISIEADDQIHVNIVPKQLKEGENTALCTPFSVTGTADELDAELPEAIKSFTAGHITLKASLAAAQADMDAAAKAIKEEAATKAKEAAKTKKSATTPMPAKPAEPPKPEAPAPPSLFDAAPAPAASSSIEATSGNSAVTPTTSTAEKPAGDNADAATVPATAAAPVAAPNTPAPAAPAQVAENVPVKDDEDENLGSQEEADAAYAAVQASADEQLFASYQ
jgi:PRTRC genetic system protein E